MNNQSDASEPALVCVIDDDPEVCGALDSLLRSAGFAVQTFTSPRDYMTCTTVASASCLVLDIRLDGSNGLDFQEELLASDVKIPVILMTGYGDIPMTVRGMKAGAVNFLSKPCEDDEILNAVGEAVALADTRRAESGKDDGVRSLYETLTPREREVMSLVTAGLMNKQVAGRLDLSEITVKIHRGNMMRKMRAPSLADLVRMAETLGVREANAARFASHG